jgi:hypothetical protein
VLHVLEQGVDRNSLPGRVESGPFGHAVDVGPDRLAGEGSEVPPVPGSRLCYLSADGECPFLKRGVGGDRPTTPENPPRRTDRGAVGCRLAPLFFCCETLWRREPSRPLPFDDVRRHHHCEGVHDHSVAALKNAPMVTELNHQRDPCCGQANNDRGRHRIGCKDTGQ